MAELFPESVRASLPECVREMISEYIADNTTVKLEIELPVQIYGLLCAGAKVHGLDRWEDLASLYLGRSFVDWSNEGYHLSRL